jgi:hypothetical protein
MARCSPDQPPPWSVERERQARRGQSATMYVAPVHGLKRQAHLAEPCDEEARTRQLFSANQHRHSMLASLLSVAAPRLHHQVTAEPNTRCTRSCHLFQPPLGCVWEAAEADGGWTRGRRCSDVRVHSVAGSAGCGYWVWRRRRSTSGGMEGSPRAALAVSCVPRPRFTPRPSQWAANFPTGPSTAPAPPQPLRSPTAIASCGTLTVPTLWAPL